MIDSISPAGAGDLPAHRATILRTDRENDLIQLREIRESPSIEILDHAPVMAQELRRLGIDASDGDESELARWAFYPWRCALVSLLGPGPFRTLRLDRNRYKITEEEQAVLAGLCIGVVGLSVGHSIAFNLAQEGLCGRLRLADFDSMELSNLNRVPAGILDLGLNKAVVAARRIAELDPYLPVDVQPGGLTEETIDEFLEGLDLLVEECDSLDIKVRVREEARRRRIPVLMETSDRGLFDAEMFDQEPDRPILHGLLGKVDAQALRGLSTHDKAPHVMRILEPRKLSGRMAASMVEIDRSLGSWPQLAGDVVLGAATVGAAVRRHARGELRSGRIRVDLDRLLARAHTPEPQTTLANDVLRSDLTAEIPTDPIESIVHAIRLAPSGGNSQPWQICVGASAIRISLDRSRPSAMDIADRGSYVAIGAATFNARVAAAHHSMTARISMFPDPANPDVVVRCDIVREPEPTLGALYRPMVERMTNRGFGRRQPISPHITRALEDDVAIEGARLVLVTDEPRLAAAAQVLAACDRIRYLTPRLHRSMIDELKWPGRDRLDTGIDIRTLSLSAADMAKLEIGVREDVMGLLARWDRGQALGDSTRERIDSSSALAVVTARGCCAADYLRGGAAVERLWIRAESFGFAVHPVSPVFLYATGTGELAQLAENYLPDLVRLKQTFGEILSVGPDEPLVLVLRLSNEAGAAERSGRLPRSTTVTNGTLSGAPTDE